MDDHRSWDLSNYHTTSEAPLNQLHPLSKQPFTFLPGKYDESDPKLFPVISKYSVFMNLINRAITAGIKYPGLYKRLPGKNDPVGKFTCFVFPDSSLVSSQKEAIQNSVVGTEDRHKLFSGTIIRPHLIDVYFNPGIPRAILGGKIHNQMTFNSFNDTMISGRQVMSTREKDDPDLIIRNITGNYYEDDYMFLIEIDGPLAKL